MKKLDVKTVMLILTEKCNLKCKYCFEHNKSQRNMNFLTAKEIVDSELSKQDGYSKVMFEFFGGEPFLEFELMKQIHNYIVSVAKKHDKEVFCFVTTNGTLVHGHVQKWLKENTKTLCCGISIDGTREIHNITRDNSYDLIDIDFFVETYPNQSCKMTISQEILPYAAEGIIELHKKGFIVTATFAQGVNWDDSDNLKILNEQLQILSDFYINNSTVPLCDLLDKKLDTILYEYEDYPKWCGCGTAMKAYDVNGNYYPCQAYAPQTLGSDADKFKNTSTEMFSDFKDEQCNGCLYLPICPTCYGANLQKSGDYRVRDKELCEFHKMCIASSAYVQYNRIMKTLNNADLAEEQYLTLKAIEKIQNEI